jgi:hypothetical protein
VAPKAAISSLPNKVAEIGWRFKKVVSFGEETTTTSSILYIRVVSMGSAGADFGTPSPFAQTLGDKNNNAKSKQMYCSRFIV